MLIRSENGETLAKGINIDGESTIIAKFSPENMGTLVGFYGWHTGPVLHNIGIIYFRADCKDFYERNTVQLAVAGAILFIVFILMICCCWCCRLCTRRRKVNVVEI